MTPTATLPRAFNLVAEKKSFSARGYTPPGVVASGGGVLIATRNRLPIKSKNQRLKSKTASMDFKTKRPTPIGDLNRPAGVLSNPNFRRWFGESKIVDDNGHPLVVYHGADDQVTVFDPQKSKNGFWFSEQRSDARDYGYEITETYLSIKKPAYFKRTNGDVGVNQAIRDAIAAGHDGLIVTSPTLDEGGDENGSTWPTNYVAFEPTQIKSVTANNGSFDPGNPDITK